jgi:hypothetical protein
VAHPSLAERKADARRCLLCRPRVRDVPVVLSIQILRDFHWAVKIPRRIGDEVFPPRRFRRRFCWYTYCHW